MKKLHSAMIAGALFACAGAAFAVEPQTAAPAAPAAQQDQARTMVAVVSVNEQGHVTRIKCAEKLPDSVNKLLKTTISKWITKPAVVNGRHVESQLLMTVQLHTEPAADGQKQAYFSYVSSEAMRNTSDWKIVDGRVIYTGKDYVRESSGIDPPRWENNSAPVSPPSAPPSSGQGGGHSA